MSRYLITLTPIDKFFFGGEITFLRSKIENKEKKKSELLPEEQKLRDFDERYSSYVIRSNYFPQQTSLLGMLRFMLLSNDKNLFTGNKINEQKKDDVVKLIGPNSFQLNDSDFNRMDFGKIKNIFPCFIQRKTDHSNWEDLVFAPFDFSFKEVSFEHGYSLSNVENTLIPVIDGYKSKEGLSYQYINETDEFKTSDLFKEDVRIGIDRDFKGKTKEGAYYKQIFYRFSDKYEISENNFINQYLRFAFYADLDCFPETKNQIVSLGGDNSRFCLHAETVQETDEIKIPKKYVDNKKFDNCHAKIVLLSDAFIEREDMKNCLFSINETLAFRFLTSNVDTKEYYKFTEGGNYLQRNAKKYNLYNRGSVFYFTNEKQLENFETALKKDCFSQIGYNNYKSIKK
jgi:CRISPR-associated protein Cmr3